MSDACNSVFADSQNRRLRIGCTQIRSRRGPIVIDFLVRKLTRELEISAHDGDVPLYNHIPDMFNQGGNETQNSSIASREESARRPVAAPMKSQEFDVCTA
jgi:hypothetical protein